MTPDTNLTLAQLADLMPDAVVGAGIDGRILWINSEAERLFGHPRSEVVGEPLGILLEGSADAETPEVFLTDPGPGESRTLVATGRRKGGSTFAVELAVKPVDDTQQPMWLATLRTLAGRQGTDALFRSLLEDVPDAVLWVDARGILAFANAQAERLFGYRREELLGQSVLTLLPAEQRDPSPLPPAGTPPGERLQITAQRKDGSTFPADITLGSVETERGALTSAAVRDATDRVENETRRRLEALEAQRRQSQQLESLGVLAGGIAHDFNNLLGVILNYALFVGRRVEDDAVATADLETIRSAATQAVELTNKLLAFGRREMVRPKILDLNVVVRDIEPVLRRTLRNDIRLLTETAEVPALVKADSGQIEQVLFNLAVNALAAMGTGGTLHVDVALMSFGTIAAQQLPDLVPGRYVRLRVGDTGVGMDAETRRRAFEPFFTTKPKGEATGLGLSTVHGIVHQADGLVDIYSVPGVGTTVTVYLPAAVEDAPGPTRPAPGDGAEGTESVLVVEDSYAVQEMTNRILVAHGYRVIVADSAEEALRTLADATVPVDLLLTDVVMPGMPGTDLANRARTVRPGLPVLLMSGYAEPLFSAQGMAETELPLLEKPFTEDELLHHVRETLDEARVVR